MTVDLNTHYGLSPNHSEVLAAGKLIKPCSTQDMGVFKRAQCFTPKPDVL